MTPGTLSVDHTPTVPIGGSEFEVTVTSAGSPLQNALVCIYKAGECYEVGYTDTLGHCILPTTVLSGGTMLLTITHHNFLPYMFDLPVEAAGCGAILLDHTVYNCEQTILVGVWDSDLNMNPGVPEVAYADLSSTSEPGPETIVLTETGSDTGEFQGTIQTSATESGPGYLLISHNEQIAAVYHDADCDGEPRDVEDTAVSDCQGPVISNVIVTDIGTDSATITWTTNEPADTVLNWGESTPPGNQESDSAMRTDHEVILTGLESCTTYFFAVSVRIQVEIRPSMTTVEHITSSSHSNWWSWCRRTWTRIPTGRSPADSGHGARLPVAVDNMVNRIPHRDTPAAMYMVIT